MKEAALGRPLLALILTPVLVLPLAWHGSALAQTDNPEKFAAGVVETIANGASNDAARSIIEAVGQPSSLLASKCIARFRRHEGCHGDDSPLVQDAAVGTTVGGPCSTA